MPVTEHLLVAPMSKEWGSTWATVRLDLASGLIVTVRSRSPAPNNYYEAVKALVPGVDLTVTYTPLGEILDGRINAAEVVEALDGDLYPAGRPHMVQCPRGQSTDKRRWIAMSVRPGGDITHSRIGLGPEIDTRPEPNLKMSCSTWRPNETYVRHDWRGIDMIDDLAKEEVDIVASLTNPPPRPELSDFDKQFAYFQNAKARARTRAA